MRIGIDATCWANERGYGRFTREVVTAMVSQASTHELVCFLDAPAAAVFAIAAPNVRPVVVSQRVPAASAAVTGHTRPLPDLLRLSRAVARERLDVFWSPSVYAYFPLPPGLPAVVTVHDAIAERFPSLTLPSWKDRLAWSAKVRLALFQSRLILTVSEVAARDIERYLRLPRARIRVTSEGVAAAYRAGARPDEIRAAARRVGIPDEAPWFTYVGGFGPHKNVDVIVRAHASVVRRHSVLPPRLVLAGPSDGFHADVPAIRRTIRDLGTESLVHWVGYLPDDELRLLHSGAVALLLVSAAEGFGLPAVEAAKCGTPVVATTESPLPELLSGGGIFLAPGDPATVADAMDLLLTDLNLRADLGRIANERASVLSWFKAAGVVLAALEEVASATEGVRSNVHART